MVQVPMEELLKQCRSVYKLVVVAAKRAKELTGGAPQLVEGEFKKSATIALEEIRQGKVVYQSDGDDAAGHEKKGRAKEKARAAAAKKRKA